ncbi:MAG: hypothetical protein LBB88_02250 [Planctomycetaceae bacterium]|nr:hypothetical protein [Planctomycetaceae bacterium]
MNSYKLTIVETQCLAPHCSIKRSQIETQSIASLRMVFNLLLFANDDYLMRIHKIIFLTHVTHLLPQIM